MNDLYRFKGAVALKIFGLIFSMDLSIWGPDFEVKTISIFFLLGSYSI
jgi:hypothetical protein